MVKEISIKTKTAQGSRSEGRFFGARFVGGVAMNNLTRLHPSSV